MGRVAEKPKVVDLRDRRPDNRAIAPAGTLPARATAGTGPGIGMAAMVNTVAERAIIDSARRSRRTNQQDRTFTPPMDLIERTSDSDRRHPWELSRADSVVRLLASTDLARRQGLRILDVGCGDGYAGRRVREALQACELVGVDAHLDEETAQAMQRPGETFVRDAALIAGSFDVVLFLDVIEHVQDDVALLRHYTDAHAANAARVLVTVPAFQSLFSRHDTALRHFRRYSLPQLREQLNKAGLTVDRCGYWFGSLLPARAVSLLVEKVGPRRSGTDSIGLGAWSGGDMLTRLLHNLMSLDNRVLTTLAARGLTIPGLSAWALCHPGQSTI